SMNLRKIIVFILMLMVLSIPVSVWAEANQTQTITDMAGRTVTVPAHIGGVLGTSPPTTMLIYMIAPDKLIGWNSNNTGFLPAKYLNLPAVGGWFGGKEGNYESFLAMHPDIILEGYNQQGDMKSTVDARQDKFGSLPVVGVENSVDALSYEKPITFMGDLLGEPAQADKMITFYKSVLDQVQSKVSAIPESKKVTVYQAAGNDGLTTEVKGSPHSQLIDIAGGINVVDEPLTDAFGEIKVSMEQVMTWNPDVIIVEDANLYKKMFTDPSWSQIKAVKDKRVYLTPKTPFSWYDHPPGVNRIIGIPWTAKMLYPDEFKDMDLNQLIKDFHSIFLHFDITDDQIKSALNPVAS
ncbi:MAG TPA: ABC transporter substrate-binding protein, partial [Methanospirillum sp.]|uniref:ABC transporter substrate-binding protein n=1 Tax=Methanospirillum sp. TaxID=45200 RepID=UPI002C14C467